MSRVHRWLSWKWVARTIKVLGGLAAVIVIYTAFDNFFLLESGPTEIEPPSALGEAAKALPAKPKKWETRSRKFSRSHRNNHCQGPTKIKWMVKPSNGWKIDVSSVRHTIPDISKKSSFGGIAPITEDGFTINASVANSGNCFRVLGATVSKDARGSIGIRVDYTEFRQQ